VTNAEKTNSLGTAPRRKTPVLRRKSAFGEGFGREEFG
jgi:hypothetical protein